jgi:hypothetical protein
MKASLKSQLGYFAMPRPLTQCAPLAHQANSLQHHPISCLLPFPHRQRTIAGLPQRRLPPPAVSWTSRSSSSRACIDPGLADTGDHFCDGGHFCAPRTFWHLGQRSAPPDFLGTHSCAQAVHFSFFNAFMNPSLSYTIRNCKSFLFPLHVILSMQALKPRKSRRSNAG